MKAKQRKKKEPERAHPDAIWHGGRRVQAMLDHHILNVLKKARRAREHAEWYEQVMVEVKKEAKFRGLCL